MIVNVATAGDQHDPVAASNARGDTLIVWASEDSSMQSTIRARVYDASGVWGDEMILGTSVRSCRTPAVAAPSAGGWVVSWTEDEMIYTTAIDDAGRPVREGEPVCPCRL
jgi:hypothetical protein